MANKNYLILIYKKISPIIKGVKKLTGATVSASDLRAGASLVVAAIMADGVSTIENLHHIDRGYENFDSKLTALGANIVRYSDETQDTRGLNNESRV